MAELNFKLERKEVSVSLELPSGDIKECTLRELTGSDRDKYLSGLSSRMKYANGKPVGLKSFDGMQANLIHLSLYDEANERFPVKEIQEFPAGVQAILFVRAQEISSLGDDDEDELGND